MIAFFPNLPPEIKENSNFETGTFRSRWCCTAFVLRPSLPHMARFFIDLATSKTISFFHLTILVNKQGFLVVTGKINHEISSTAKRRQESVTQTGQAHTRFRIVTKPTGKATDGVREKSQSQHGSTYCTGYTMRNTHTQKKHSNCEARLPQVQVAMLYIWYKTKLQITKSGCDVSSCEKPNHHIFLRLSRRACKSSSMPPSTPPAASA
jgi:hypothetical protein